MAQTTKNERKDIKSVIDKIEKPNFTFSRLAPEDFAPVDGDAYVVATKKEGNRERSRLTTTQLRKLFAEIKRLEKQLKGSPDTSFLTPEFYNELWLLQPELAYARGRGLIDEDFFKLMRVSLSKDKLKTVADFRRFSQFLTAVVAYSKYAEKKKQEE